MEGPFLTGLMPVFPPPLCGGGFGGGAILLYLMVVLPIDTSLLGSILSLDVEGGTGSDADPPGGLRLLRRSPRFLKEVPMGTWLQHVDWTAVSSQFTAVVIAGVGLWKAGVKLFSTLFPRKE